VSLSILNNVAALYAENSLSNTQASLQSTLQQLSSGSRIDSGANDAAGLAVANGLGANEAALTQSVLNAGSGIGLLQTADGALSQVTNLLDRATTLATEAANGTLTSAQVSSANQEYQNILSQIGNIGTRTNFNSTNVFSSGITNFVVTDGTASGLNTYADSVGVLTQASVGTTGASPIASVVSTPPVVAIPNQAGQYTLTAGSSSDTVAGNISYRIGGGAQRQINVVAGSSLATVSGQLTSAGFANTVSGNVIDITGPTAGADAAANTVNFSGTLLAFTPVATSLASGSYATIVTPASLSMATLSLAGIPGNSTPFDTFGGTILVSQAGQTSVTVNIIAGSRLGPIASNGTVEYQIAQQLLGSAYTLTASDGNDADPVLHFSGAGGDTSPVTVAVGTFADSYRGGVTFTPASPSNASPQITQNTYTLSALANSADTFGSSAGNANTLDINGANVSIAGLTATAAMSAINGTAALQAAGIFASISSNLTTLTIDGNPSGGALSVQGYNGGALDLTDQPPADWLTGNAIGTPGNMAQPGSGAFSFSGANSGDSFGGNFTLSQAGSSPLTIAIQPGSTLNSVEQQISMQAMHSNFELMHIGGTPSNPVFTFMGFGNSAPIAITEGSLSDSTTPSAAFTGGPGTPGIAATPETYKLAAFSSSSDTFGSGAGNANMLDIDGAEISIAGMTAGEAAQAIDGNFNMQSYGISASANAAGTQVTLLGNANGGNFTVSGYNGTALALSDSEIPSSTITQTVAPQGSVGAGGTAVITMSSSTDTLSGPLKVVVDGHTASLTVAPGTSGSALASQIDLDHTFQAASLTAFYDSTNATIIITGPTGAGNTLDSTGTTLTDTTSAGTLAGAGANFTPASVSQLSAGTAANVLSTVTSAIADVAYQRGTLGGDINQLVSASNVASAESVNLLSAQNSILATDYGKAASDLSKYQILSQTGISALAQANSVQQEVLKLIQ
jgi:flagellin